MEDRLMSQKELEEKYGENRGAFSHAMNLAGVKEAMVSEDKKWPVKLYREGQAVAAIALLYLQRGEDHARKAEAWRAESEKTLRKYWESYGENPDEHLGLDDAEEGGIPF